MAMSVPEHIPEDASGNPSNSHVMEAVREGDVDSVRALLEAGVDVNLSSQKLEGRFCISLAVRWVVPLSRQLT